MIFLVFIETVTVYSTPNLKPPDFSKGDGIKYDQVSKSSLENSSSSEEYLSNDHIVKYLRNENDESEKSGSEGYIFNEKLCKLIKKRILCGYDRNKGELSEEKSVNISNNCIIRNDRIECGYSSKPLNNSLHLRFRSITDTESSITTISNKIDSKEKQLHENISENSITTTELPVQLPTSNTSDSTMNAPNTPGKSFKEEISTVTQPSKITSDTMLLNKSSPAILSSSAPTITTVKKSDLTTSKSSFINFVKNVTTNKIELPIHSNGLNNEINIENRNKTKIVRQGLIRKLMNNIENEKEIRREQPHIEAIPLSKNCKCPYQASIIKDSSTTLRFLRERKNSKSLRKGNDESKIKTSCVENNERIVCLDYKLE